MPKRTLKPFIIIGNARTGTGYLRSSIDSHPQARCLGELLHAYDDNLRRVNHCKYFYDQDWLKYESGFTLRETAEKYLTEKIWAELPADGILGFKLLFWQIEHFNLWNCLSNSADRLNIVLLSRNPIAVFVSHEQAQKTNNWIKLEGDDVSTAASVKLNFRKFYAHAENMLRFEDRIRKLARYLLEIRYENLVNDYSDTMNQVFTFLGLSPFRAQTATLKQQDWNIKSRISNFEVVNKRLSKKYKHYLEGML